MRNTSLVSSILNVSDTVWRSSAGNRAGANGNLAIKEVGQADLNHQQLARKKQGEAGEIPTMPAIQELCEVHGTAGRPGQRLV